MNKHILFRPEKASALVVVLLTLAILSILAGSLVLNVHNRRITLSQSSAWQEALVAAEAGLHQGIAQVEQGLFQNALPDTTSSPTDVTLVHGGEGPTSAAAKYTLEKRNFPIGCIININCQPFYRIVSTGTVGLPGGKFLSMDGRDAVLRKLNLQSTNQTATRQIEAWLQPVYNKTEAGLSVDDLITLNNHNIFIDSFDSTDSNRSVAISGSSARGPSTTQGEFNIAPYNILAANISTNSAFLSAGNAYIYGDAYTNGGTPDTILQPGHIMGQLYDDYYQEMAPVYAPQWSFATSVPNINNSYTFTGGTAASPKQYIVNSIKLSGGKQVTFDFGKTGANPDPAKNYIEIYVTGAGITTRGSGTTDGSFVIVNGVNVKMYVSGDLNFSGNGLANNNDTAASLTIYGINPPAGGSQTFTLSGSATFFGTVYAPGAALILSGGGSGSQFVGSLAGKTAFLNGTTQIRYDEALDDQQKTLTSFKTAAWFEDARSSEANRQRPF
jgi:hypothetical protein